METKPREVPSRQAEKFLEGIGDDPKFQRFQTRMALSSEVTSARSLRSNKLLLVALLRVRAKRIVSALIAVKSMFLAALIVTFAIPLWYGVAASFLFGIGGSVFLWRQLKRTKVAIEVRSEEVGQLDEMIDQALFQIAQIDKLSGQGIKIVDPAVFDLPQVKQKLEA